MENQLFKREDYFSKTELLKIYSLPWVEFEELFIKFEVHCLEVPYRSHGGKATYIKKGDIESLAPFIKTQERFYKADFVLPLRSVLHEPQFPNARIIAEAKAVDVFLKRIRLRNCTIYKGTAYKRYQTTISGGTFVIEKIENKWSIVKDLGAPIWILDNEAEIVDFIALIESSNSSIV